MSTKGAREKRQQLCVLKIQKYIESEYADLVRKR